MDLSSFIEDLVRQKLRENQGNPHFSEENLTAEVLYALQQKGIHIEEANSPVSPTPPKRRIAIGSDHGGFELKEILVQDLKKQNYSLMDVGPFNEDSVDYPDFAQKVAELVSQGICTEGIMIDGVGIGSCMVANKVAHVRASHCHNLFEARNAKEHNNANVLTLGGRVIGTELAKAITKTWLETPFAGGRHERRVQKIIQVEQKYLRSSCPS